MKGVILAGGNGTRLKPFTDSTQKQLLPIANTAVIDHIISDFELVGINEIGVVIGGKFPDKVTEHFSKNTYPKSRLTTIKQGKPRGLADAVMCAKKFVGDDPFIVYFGDTIAHRSYLDSIVQRYNADKFSAYVSLKQVFNPQNFGVVEFKNGEIMAFHEKPDNPPSEYAYVGILAFNNRIFDIISNLEPSDRGELELTSALNELALNSAIQWSKSKDLWIDVGTPTGYLNANKAVIQKSKIDKTIDNQSILLDTDSKLEHLRNITPGTKIRAPVLISKTAKICSGAKLGPYTIIGHDTRIVEADIRNSVVMDDCYLDHSCVINNSIIGFNSKIKKSNQ